MMLESSESTFNQDINVADSVVVEFYSENCLPCKTMREILQKFSDKNDNIKIYNLNIKKSRGIAKKYGIKSVPTLIVFENGQPVKKRFGTLTVSDLENIVKEKMPQVYNV